VTNKINLKKACHVANKTKDWAAVGHTNKVAASQFWKKLENS
jgi:hypothetical protein